MDDYYEILEVSPDASDEKIQEQYRFLVQAWHPDKFKSTESKAKGEEKLKKINEAYSILKDAIKREQYDRQRQVQKHEYEARAETENHPKKQAKAKARESETKREPEPRPIVERKIEPAKLHNTSNILIIVTLIGISAFIALSLALGDILVTSIIGVLGMVLLPILLGFWLVRKFKLSWKLFFAGALTFIASQVLHIPFLYGLTALFANGILPSPPAAWATAFNAVLLGLLAGIFEETARYILFKFSLKKARTWNEGVLVGAGHGGVEAIIIGVIGVLTVVNMVIMRNADLSAMGIPADQLALANQQVSAFWDSPAYMGLLGLAERVFAICLHISLSAMVLYSVAYKKPIWFWLAMLWHAVVDAAAVYLLPIIGAMAVEGVVGVMAIVSLVILFGLRPRFRKQDQHEVPNEAQVGV